MRVPGRLNITWVDDNTLKVDMDAGTQTRLFRFNATVPPGTPKSLQGYSDGDLGGRWRRRSVAAAAVEAQQRRRLPRDGEA